MEETQNMRGLLSPQMAQRVAQRIGICVRAKLTASHKSKSAVNWTDQVEASNEFINIALNSAPLGVAFAAVEYPIGHAYGRKAVEKSGCPILQAKHGHYGRFLVARCTNVQAGNIGVSGVLYEDATKSNQDILITTKFSVELGSIFCNTRLPNILKARDPGYDTDGVPHLSSLSNILSLSELLVKSTISINPAHISSLEHQYSNRVAQYEKAVQAVGTELIPQQAKQLDDVLLIK